MRIYAHIVYLIVLIAQCTSEWKCYKDPGLHCTHTDVRYMGSNMRLAIKNEEGIEMSSADEERYKAMYAGLNQEESEKVKNKVKVLFREEVKRRFGWTKDNYVSFLYNDRWEKNDLHDKRGTSYFALVANCIYAVRLNPKETPIFRVQIVSSPLSLSYELDNCVPTEEYLPVINTKDNSTWFVNNGPGKQEMNGKTGGPWGVTWKFGTANVPKSIYERMTALTHEDFKDDYPGNYPVWPKIQETLKAKMNEKSTTGYDWKTVGDDAYKVFDACARKDRYGLYLGCKEPQENFPIEPKYKAQLFELVGKCGAFTIYTNIILARYYTLDTEKCTEPFTNTRKGTIEDCNFCPDLNKCPQITTLKN